MPENQLVYMYIIAERKNKEPLITDLLEHGAAMIDFVYARGSYEMKNILDFLGFADEPGKILINCLLSRNKGNKMIDVLTDKYMFGRGGQGIAFTVPVECLSF